MEESCYGLLMQLRIKSYRVHQRASIRKTIIARANILACETCQPTHEEYDVYYLIYPSPQSHRIETLHVPILQRNKMRPRLGSLSEAIWQPVIERIFETSLI